MAYVVKTGEAAPIGKAGQRYNAAHEWHPFVAPPIPPAYYNPILDIQNDEGNLSTEQGIEGLERQKTNAENRFNVGISRIGEREGDTKQQAQEAVERLTRAYHVLGARQADQASAGGTLYGGAMIASAQKRAANEALERTAKANALQRALQGYNNERGQLALEKGELLGEGKSLGSITEAIRNLGLSGQQHQEGIQKLKIAEATGAGYNAPTGPLEQHNVVKTGEAVATHPAQEARERKEGKRK